MFQISAQLFSTSVWVRQIRMWKKSCESRVRVIEERMYFFCFSRAGAACLGSVNLKGRSCLTLKDFSSDEIKKLLWVSGDLKHRIKHEKQVFNFNCKTSVLIVGVLCGLWVVIKSPFYFSICLFYKESRLQ